MNIQNTRLRLNSHCSRFLATLGVALTPMFCALAQQTNITVSIQTLSDQSKLISWNSVPGVFYTIESAETLDPSSLAQLQWVRRETGVPSQGTKTVWIDVGDPVGFLDCRIPD